jgi:hypothetical protein
MKQPSSKSKQQQRDYKSKSNSKYSDGISENKKSIKELIEQSTTASGKIALKAVLKSGYAIVSLKVPSSVNKRKLTMELASARKSGTDIQHTVRRREYSNKRNTKITITST